MLYNIYTGNLITIDLNQSFKELLNTNGGIINLLFSIEYLSPLLSIIMFIYLFYKKGIKYNIVIYTILTFTLTTFIYSAIKSNLGIFFIELFTTPIIFLTIYTLTDYKCSPTINETCMIYGIFMGLITALLSIISPIFIPVAFIIGSLLLTKILDKQSYKIKYKK